MVQRRLRRLGKGLSTLVRITVMAFAPPMAVRPAIGATLIASSFQLMIPRLLERGGSHLWRSSKAALPDLSPKMHC